MKITYKSCNTADCLSGQLGPCHLLAEKSIMPPVTDGTFYRLLPAMNNTFRAHSRWSWAAVSAPLFCISLSQGFLFSLWKSTVLFWAPLQHASPWSSFLPWQHTQQVNNSPVRMCSNTTFPTKGHPHCRVYLHPVNRRVKSSGYTPEVFTNLHRPPSQPSQRILWRHRFGAKLC
jgi:hypothetical protein